MVQEHDALCPSETFGLNCSCWLIREVQKAERHKMLELFKRNQRPEIPYDGHYNCSAPDCRNSARWDWVAEYLCDTHDSVMNLQLRLMQAGELIGDEIGQFAEKMGEALIKDDDDYFVALHEAKEIAVAWGKNAGA